jgi:phosphoribosylformimino-5-aminoimidazole carboxamide ribotide isomerase
MKIYPAIDLLGGCCVRLQQGNFGIAKVYDADPVAVATKYRAEGATDLHVVDLDGSKRGALVHGELIGRLSRTGLAVQAGGGVRTLSDVQGLFAAGVQRVVIGSLATRDPDAITAMAKAVGAVHFTIAVDVRVAADTPHVAVEGWQAASGRTLWDVAGELYARGFENFLCTDISRDGMLTGPNLDLYREFVRRQPHAHVLASGGIGALDDVRRVRDTGVAGVIIGKALYEGRFTLAEALSC